MEIIKLNKLIMEINSLTQDEKEKVINHLSNLDDLVIDVEGSEESPYYPYQYNTINVSYKDDVILELTENRAEEVLLKEIADWLCM